jgi:hypothetical protein
MQVFPFAFDQLPSCASAYEVLTYSLGAISGVLKSKKRSGYVALFLLTGDQ